MCSQLFTEAMLWIKDVEMVESVVDLKSSRSTKGTHGPDIEMLDASIASALNKNHPEYPLQEKGQSGGNESSNRRLFFRGVQIDDLIYEYFQVNGANDSVENYADLLTVVVRNDDIQELDSKWDEILFIYYTNPI